MSLQSPSPQTPQRSPRDADATRARVRKFTAMLAAWPRRSPRLLMPAPASRFPSTPGVVVSPRDLPDEVLLAIFELLPKARDIAAVRGVCRTWCKLVDRTATIWRSLVFDLPKSPSTACSAESWYRKAADYGNTQAQVRFDLDLFYCVDMKV